MIDDVSIAAPCSADWDSMPGSDQVRHCSQCHRNVYNLSAMTRRQAEALLRETEGRLCARLYRRADGTILTENCPEGLRAIGRRLSRVAGAAMAAVATLSSSAAAQFPFFQIPAVLQDADSAVTGVVQDAGGRAIRDAMVVVTQDSSGRLLEARTDDTGSFRVGRLGFGLYTIRVQASGFNSFTKRALIRGASQEFRLTATLLVGTMGGAVVVELPR